MHAEHQHPILYRHHKAYDAQRSGDEINPERESDLTETRTKRFCQHRTQHGGKHPAEHEYCNNVRTFIQHAIDVIYHRPAANHHGNQHHKVVNGENTPLIVAEKNFHIAGNIQIFFFDRLDALFSGRETDDKHQAADNAKYRHGDLNTRRPIARIKKIGQR